MKALLYFVHICSSVALPFPSLSFLLFLYSSQILSLPLSWKSLWSNVKTIILIPFKYLLSNIIFPYFNYSLKNLSILRFLFLASVFPKFSKILKFSKICVTQKLTKIVEPNEIHRKKSMSEVFSFSSPVFLWGYLPFIGDTNNEYRGLVSSALF